MSIIYLCIVYSAYAVNSAQFFNITFLSPLFAAAPLATMFATVIVPLTSIYVSL